VLDLLELVGWPPSLLMGGLVIVVSFIYGTQARHKTRPYLLATQIATICIIIDAIFGAFAMGDYWPTAIITALLSQTLGIFLGYMIIGWIIVRICFTIRFRNAPARIFTRNRRP